MGSGRLAVIGAVLCGALVSLAATASAARAVSVSLKASAAQADLGASVSFTAAAHGLAHGDHVRIVGVRTNGEKFTVAECAKATCSGRHADSLPQRLAFRALVLRHGRPIAHSAAVFVRWGDTTPAPAPAPAPAPPPPPAPSAAAGHYCGLSNEGKSICFDVTPAPQQVLTNLQTESIANCGDGSSWIWTLPFNRPISILQPGLTANFQFSGNIPDTSDGSATHIQIAYSVNATFDTAGNASGTIVLTHISWDAGGTHYDCAGDPRTWNARLGA
jgi:hypothetical protein